MTDGQYVDVTPPVVRNMFCVDPWYSMTQPASKQQANDSVAAFWEFSEIESLLSYYEVAIGLQPFGQQFMNFTNVGLERNPRFFQVKGNLTEGETYFITVKAYNKAGLTTTAFCNITVSMVPINVTGASPPSAMYETQEKKFPDGVAATDQLDKIGVTWTREEVGGDSVKWIGKMLLNLLDTDCCILIVVSTQLNVCGI